MKVNRSVVVSFMVLFALAAGAVAQEKPKANPDTPLKILVVFNEFDGEKKVSSMPYTLYILSSDERGRAMGSLRMGIKVPIQTAAAGKEGQGGSFQYMDVGTYIDCRVTRPEEGRYSLELTVRRSSVYMPPGAASGREGTFTAGELSGRPVVQEFSGSFVIILRDAESKQGTVATDPLTGRQLKVDVTLNVVK